MFRWLREEPCAELSVRGQMSDTGLQDTEGSEKRWLPGQSTQNPGDKCKDRGISDKFRPVSGESEAGAQAKTKGGTNRENAV